MNEISETLTIRQPDDWHVHFRDGAMLAAVAGLTARQFARAIVMPNLMPPVTSVAAASAYRERILAALPLGAHFTPLMTCYLTDEADADEVGRGFAEGAYAAVKYYPAHATTHSAQGVTAVGCVTKVFERMQEIGMPLLIHGEVTDPDVDIFDREAVFIERTLAPLLADFPALKVVLEHVTTADAVDFVRAQDGRLGATVTAHHLMINRNALLVGGIRPHLYCLPVAKRERHRLALRGATTSGEASFFLGTDSAPHALDAKETDCGCAGIFTAASALELYAGVFAEDGALDQLEAFASLNGPGFYGLPVNEQTVTLARRPWTVPDTVPVAGSQPVKPFLAGEIVDWRMVED
ncbi:MAG: dihydroorotase [Rhodospirillales bacterium]|jgi:dihydroorotase|nr:dihydroorotase [Rhodospirillales bacterium]HJO98068.1 dihydroorotase [Rhodospirillales bacterium]